MLVELVCLVWPENAGVLVVASRVISSYIMTRRFRTLIVACIAESLRPEFQVGATLTLFKGIYRLKGISIQSYIYMLASHR